MGSPLQVPNHGTLRPARFATGYSTPCWNFSLEDAHIYRDWRWCEASDQVTWVWGQGSPRPYTLLPNITTSSLTFCCVSCLTCAAQDVQLVVRSSVRWTSSTSTVWSLAACAVALTRRFIYEIVWFVVKGCVLWFTHQIRIKSHVSRRYKLQHVRSVGSKISEDITTIEMQHLNVQNII